MHPFFVSSIMQRWVTSLHPTMMHINPTQTIGNNFFINLPYVFIAFGSSLTTRYRPSGEYLVRTLLPGQSKWLLNNQESRMVSIIPLLNLIHIWIRIIWKIRLVNSRHSGVRRQNMLSTPKKCQPRNHSMLAQVRQVRGLKDQGARKRDTLQSKPPNTQKIFEICFQEIPKLRLNRIHSLLDQPCAHTNSIQKEIRL